MFPNLQTPSQSFYFPLIFRFTAEDFWNSVGPFLNPSNKHSTLLLVIDMSMEIQTFISCGVPRCRTGKNLQRELKPSYFTEMGSKQNFMENLQTPPETFILFYYHILVFSTQFENMLLKLDHFPKVRGEN